MLGLLYHLVGKVLPRRVIRHLSLQIIALLVEVSHRFMTYLFIPFCRYAITPVLLQVLDIAKVQVSLSLSLRLVFFANDYARCNSISCAERLFLRKHWHHAGVDAQIRVAVGTNVVVFMPR